MSFLINPSLDLLTLNPIYNILVQNELKTNWFNDNKLWRLLKSWVA